MRSIAPWLRIPSSHKLTTGRLVDRAPTSTVKRELVLSSRSSRVVSCDSALEGGALSMRLLLSPFQRARCRAFAVVSLYSLRGYEPNQLDNFDYSETSAAIFHDESVDMDTEPSHPCDAELDDELIEKALSSPLFIQEREEPANLRQTYHSHEESLLPAQSFFTRTSTGRPVYEPSSDLSQKRKSSREIENERIRILLERQKEQILAEVRTEIQKHEFQADSCRRSIQELNGIIESQRREIDHR